MKYRYSLRSPILASVLIHLMSVLVLVMTDSFSLDIRGDVLPEVNPVRMNISMLKFEPETEKAIKPKKVLTPELNETSTSEKKTTYKEKTSATTALAVKPKPILKSAVAQMIEQQFEPKNEPEDKNNYLKPVPPETRVVENSPNHSTPSLNSKSRLNLIAFEEDQYRRLIIQLIEENKFYPNRARKMRKEGKVLVSFTLNRNGSLRDLNILEVIGHSSFKKATMKAVQTSENFPPFPDNSHRQTWSFKTTLTYRLI